MDNKQKILVCGDVEGKFKTLFGRVQSINEKTGPFDFLFCVGDFFGKNPALWEPYRIGTLKVPVPTYILGPQSEQQVAFYNDPSGHEICPNVNYLGKRGILTSGGLSIAYVSGSESQAPDSPIYFTKSDVSAVKEIALKSKVGNNSFLGVDILLSSVWPKNITSNHEACHCKDTEKNDSVHLSWLAAHLRPRYYFAGTENIYYERPPYENVPIGNEPSIHCTRFIALARVGSSGNNKWLYAASIAPLEQMKASELYQYTTDQTPCPFLDQLIDPSLEQKQYFYDMNASYDDGKKRRREGGNSNERKKPNFDQSSCWFCLGSPQVEKHLVVSIGDVAYIALAKGAINENHVMILPVQHHQSYAFLPDQVKAEVKKFKSALKKYFKKLKMVAVFFERNFKTSHMQIHVVPVPKKASAKLKTAFISGAEEQGLELSELPEHTRLQDSTQEDSPYFYVELPSSERLFCSCKKNFPLEFGRCVLAGEDILDLPHRVGWRDCVVSKNEEIKLAESFRAGFKEFDFTVEADDDDD